MLCFIASDIHTEFHKDGGVDYFKTAPEADVFICAGDLGSSSSIDKALMLAKKKYEHIIFVPGNHEFYGASFTSFRKHLLASSSQQLHVLDNGATEIQGVRFVGTTLWFPESSHAWRNRFALSDFQQIRNFDPFVAASDARSYLERTVSGDDVVVTHHLPSYRCVNERYKDSKINCFFVHEMTEFILRRQPKFWIHGHTHESVNIQLGSTTVLCNPFGYAGYELNANYTPLMIEL